MTAPPHSTRATVERQVLEIVAGLVAELGHGTAPQAALDDSLDRDLGISSLERVELLLRIERALGIRLADSVMAEAGSPGDLVAAILTAAPAKAETAPEPIPAATPGTPAPASARTLVEVLQWHADRTPDRVHVHLRQEDGSETPITYGDLLTGASAVSAGLRGLGVKAGDTVALMLRTEAAFFDAFFGALLAGAVPVPLYPPFRRDELLDYARRQQAILRNAAARVLVTFGEVERLVPVLRAGAPSLDTVTTVERLAAHGTGAAAATTAAEDPALIQYTSGSTGTPKGVLLSQANILANIRAIGEEITIRPDDVAVSWLPLYHDMGLIGAWLGSLYFGVPAALMSPLAFLSRPSRWLWAVHAHRGTISPAPNFAFDLAVRKITDDEIQGLEIGSWRLALNGSEMVSPDTLERFARKFAPYGFKPEAMRPVYGLAEASVGLTIGPIDRLPRIDALEREPFERARQIQPATAAEPRPLQFVSCGRPLPGHDVRIVDASARPLGERIEGHVQFRGPSVTRGYYHNPDATRAVVRDGWMDSGDLGYQVDGELFITGREKDLIIQGGRNVYAQEVEDLAATVPGIRKGCVAAFGVHDPSRGTERLVVVAETREGAARRDALRQEVTTAIVNGIGAPPDVVVITNPRTVLKTSSGKIRRAATRDAYVDGTLGRGRSATWQSIGLVAAAFGARAGRTADWIGRVLYTGYVLIVLLVTLPVLWVSLLLLPAGRHANRAVKRWSRVLLALCGVRPRVEGMQNLTEIRSGILVANHASYIDAIVLMAAIPPEFRFIAKRKLADYPLIGTVIRKAGHATIEKADVAQRLAGAAEIATLLHDDKDLLMIFPEGTFFPTAGLLPFRLGAFRAAVERGRPIVPIALRGTRHILPDGTRLVRHGPIHVSIGEPLHPRADGWHEMVRLRDAAREEIARGAGEASHGEAPTRLFSL